MSETYDIIEWKSCASLSGTDSSTDDQQQAKFNLGGYPISRDGIYSTTDIVFPKLFHEDRDESEESSIISIPDLNFDYDGPLDYYKEKPPDHVDEQTVYQKVSSWMLSQRKYFSNTEPFLFEDDEMEVIDPVDLFHESILDEYFFIAENDCERRAVFRELRSNHYEIQSIEESMKTFEYKFLRKPQENIEIELTPLISFHQLHKRNTISRSRRKRLESFSTVSSYAENEEESLDFLGVPRLLENYIILNREGYVVKTDMEADLWLSPLKEELIIDETRKDSHEEIEFLSSWFSDVYQDLNTDENRTLITDKVTVISVSRCSDDEVWVDAPEIPHWLDEEHDELELFNQPSRPLYYYRDRIKGCYRIIGVEDETVVLFSGNDDDTIFYNEGDELRVTNTFPEPKISRNYLFAESDRPQNKPDSALPPQSNQNSFDRKNDSGIEDIDDMIGEEVAIASISLSNVEAHKLGYKTQQQIQKNTLTINPYGGGSLSEWLLLMVICVCFVVLVVLYCARDLDTSKVNYRVYLKIVEETYCDFKDTLNSLFSKPKNKLKNNVM